MKLDLGTDFLLSRLDEVTDLCLFQEGVFAADDRQQVNNSLFMSGSSNPQITP